MDRIFIKGLRVETVIGLHAWERRVRQPLVVDLEMASNVRQAAATDEIADALDYEAISERLVGAIEQSSFELLETLAERLAAIVRQEFAVPWVRVRLTKAGALRGAREIGVEIERGEPPP